MTRARLAIVVAVAVGCSGQSQTPARAPSVSPSPGTTDASPSPEVVKALVKLCDHAGALTRLPEALGKATERLQHLEVSFEDDASRLDSLGQKDAAALARDLAEHADFLRIETQRVEDWSDAEVPPGFVHSTKQLVGICGA